MSRAIWEYYKTQIENTGLDYLDKKWEFTSDEDITEFAATASDSGTLTVADTIHGGVALVTCKNTTDDNYVTVVGDASYLTLGLGRKVLYWTRLKVSDATQTDWFTGIFKADTELVGGWTDGVCFRSDDGDVNVDGVIHGASTESVSTLTTAADDTFMDLLMYVSMDATTAAKGTVTFYKDGTSLGTLSSITFPLETVLQTVEFALQSGNATGQKIMTVDFVRLMATI